MWLLTAVVAAYKIKDHKRNKILEKTLNNRYQIKLWVRMYVSMFISSWLTDTPICTKRDMQFFFKPGSFAASALKMETVCFSKTMASTNESTWHRNQEEHRHDHHRRENLRFHNSRFVQSVTVMETSRDDLPLLLCNLSF
jgi:hypothetical protein